MIIEKIKHFPVGVLNFLKYIGVGLFKTWGSTILMLILLFLYATGSLTVVYYKISLSFEKYKIEQTLDNIKKELVEIKKYQDNTKCYKNQIIRIANSEEVSMKHCK